MLKKIKLKHYNKKYKLNSVEMVEYLKKVSGLEKNKQEIETLFLGSSHFQMGINPNLFPDNSVYNLAIGSQDLYNSFKLYEKYSKELPKLKNIFIEYSVFSAGYEIEKSINAPFQYYYKSIFGIPFKYDYKNLDKALELIKREAQKISLIPKGYKGYTDYVTFYNEYIAMRDIKAHIKHAMRNNHQENYIKSMLEIAENNEQNLFVVIPPHSPTYIKLQKEECANNNISYEVLFKPLSYVNDLCDNKLVIANFFDRVEFSDEDFYDLEHLNPTGNIKFTKMLYKELFNEVI